MSKKQFIALAATIRNNPQAFTPDAIALLIQFCKSQNPQFNESTFRNAIAP